MLEKKVHGSECGAFQEKMRTGVTPANARGRSMLRMLCTYRRQGGLYSQTAQEKPGGQARKIFFSFFSLFFSCFKPEKRN
jgi:hypothetical protein